MITNQNDINEYKEYNKVYIPTNYINQNYNYRYNGDYIIITTNNNCYTNYNTTYCDCYSYNYKNNVITESYACNINTNSTQYIAYSNITDNINYSNYIKEQYTNDYIIYFLILILGIIFCNLLLKERKCL